MTSIPDNPPAAPLDDPAQRSALRELLTLAGPTIAQMASYTVMQFIDTWMLTRISDTAATAAGQGGLIAFSAISMGFGVLLLVNTLASQSYGRRDHPACGRYLWQGVWFSIPFALCLLPLILLFDRAFGWFNHPPELARLETLYLTIVLSASGIKLVSTSLAQFLLAINRPRAVLAGAVIGVVANWVAALGLVLGYFGIQPMGVAGAAWAQNIGVTVEMLVLLAICLRNPVRKTYGLTQWRFRPREFWTLLRLGVPSGVQISGDVLAWTLFAAFVMAQLGPDAMAANNYMFRYLTVAFMPVIGIGSAVTTLVGRYMGRGRPDLSAQRANLGFYVAGAYTLLCGAFFFFGRHALIGLFTSDPNVLRMGSTLLVFAAVYEVFDAMYLVYVGALRGAGDTFVPGMMTAGLNWSVTVCGGYLVARFLPGLGVAGPWYAATLYGILLGLFMLARFRRGGWKSIQLEKPSRPPAACDTVPGSLATDR